MYQSCTGRNDPSFSLTKKNGEALIHILLWVLSSYHALALSSEWNSENFPSSDEALCGVSERWINLGENTWNLEVIENDDGCYYACLAKAFPSYPS